MDFLMTPRSKWGAEPIPDSLEDIELPIKHVFHMDISTLKCMEANSCEMRMREIMHREISDVGHRDIRYNFVVGGNSMMYEGRGWKKRGVLPNRFLDKVKDSIVIGYIGRAGIRGMPEWMTKAADNFVKKGVSLGYVDENYESIMLFQQYQRDEQPETPAET